MHINSKIFSGTSGIVLPVSNKLQYPIEFQDKSRLVYYASLFNSVEINSSFYKIPLANTVGKWAESVPNGFKFTFKLWREITHIKELDFKPEDVSRFMRVISNAVDKEGCLLVQFPPSFSATYMHKLAQLLDCIQQADTEQRWKVAVEFRNRTWYTEEITELLSNYNSNLVIHDLPASAAPLAETMADFIYLRFHGPNGGYRGSYDDDFLSEYAYFINDWILDGKTVFIHFNNTMGDAVSNLITLNNFLKELASNYKNFDN